MSYSGFLSSLSRCGKIWYWKKIRQSGCLWAFVSATHLLQPDK